MHHLFQAARRALLCILCLILCVLQTVELAKSYYLPLVSYRVLCFVLDYWLYVYDITLPHCLQGQRVLTSFKVIQGPQCFSFVTMLHKAFSLHSSLSMQVKDGIPDLLSYTILSFQFFVSVFQLHDVMISHALVTID